MDPELARFYEAWLPVLRGTSNVGDCLSALGHSRSPAVDLAFYRVLVERNAAAILGALFPTTRAQVMEHLPGRWLSWVADYERRTSSAHCNPNEWGRDFPSFIAALARQEGRFPALIEELADYEWLHYALGAGVAPELPPAAACQLDIPAYAVRQYDHDIPRLVKDSRSFAQQGAPPESATVVIVYRHAVSGHARVCYPSRAALLVLALPASPSSSVSSALSEVERDTLAAAELELVRLGVLARAARAE